MEESAILEHLKIVNHLEKNKREVEKTVKIEKHQRDELNKDKTTKVSRSCTKRLGKPKRVIFDSFLKKYSYLS